jgi:hypothetical protein
MPRLTDKPHARIYFAWMELPAWTTLRPEAQALLVNVMTRYRPLDTNAFEISDRTATMLVNCARNTAAKALEELVDREWFRVIRVGRIRGPKALRATIYALTMYPLDDAEPAPMGFLRWQPHPIQGLKLKPSTAQIRAVNGSFQPPQAGAQRSSPEAATH